MGLTGTNRHRSKDPELLGHAQRGICHRQILKSSIAEFEASHPDVHINLSIHPWSLAWNRFIDVIKGRYLGPAPDVLQVGTTHVDTLLISELSINSRRQRSPPR